MFCFFSRGAQIASYNEYEKSCFDVNLVLWLYGPRQVLGQKEYGKYDLP